MTRHAVALVQVCLYFGAFSSLGPGLSDRWFLPAEAVVKAASPRSSAPFLAHQAAGSPSGITGPYAMLQVR